MKRVLLIILALLILFVSPIMAKERTEKQAQQLIEKNCASCHTLEMPHPRLIASLPAPPMNAIIFHVKKEIKNPEEQKAFIVNYALHPTPEVSVCDMNKIKKFGLMPSLKGKVSKKELAILSDYLLKNFPSKSFVESRAEAKLYREIYNLKNSPFLLNQSALPKITQLLMQNWGKGKLGLDEEQKRKLLAIRHSVIGQLKEIKDKLYYLEQEIIEMTIDAEEIELIELKVNEVAKLKAKSSMIQIRCIIQSVKILNPKQLAVLVPLWD